MFPDSGVPISRVYYSQTFIIVEQSFRGLTFFTITFSELIYLAAVICHLQTRGAEKEVPMKSMRQLIFLLQRG